MAMAMPPPVPANESERLAAVEACGVVDTEPDPQFDDLVALAAAICHTPIAIVSFITADEQIIKARVGLNYAKTPRNVAFCAHTIAQASGQPLIVRDATLDERFRDNPSVVGEPHIRFYAGVPIVNHAGLALGTVCAIDTVPKDLNPQQIASMKILARHVLIHLEIKSSELRTRLGGREG